MVVDGITCGWIKRGLTHYPASSPGPAPRGDPGHGPKVSTDSLHLRRGGEAPPRSHRRHQALSGPLRQRGRGQLPKSSLPLPQVRPETLKILHRSFSCSECLSGKTFSNVSGKPIS